MQKRMDTKYYDIQIIAGIIILIILATLSTKNIPIISPISNIGTLLLTLYIIYTAIMRTYYYHTRIEEDENKITIKYPFNTITIEKKNITTTNTINLKLFKKTTYKTNNGEKYTIYEPAKDS
jgi:hypothetical protein